MSFVFEGLSSCARGRYLESLEMGVRGRAVVYHMLLFEAW